MTFCIPPRNFYWLRYKNNDNQYYLKSQFLGFISHLLIVVYYYLFCNCYFYSLVPELH